MKLIFTYFSAETIDELRMIALPIKLNLPDILPSSFIFRSIFEIRSRNIYFTQALIYIKVYL